MLSIDIAQKLLEGGAGSAEMSHEKAVEELYRLQYAYADCCGNQGPILKEATALTDKYNKIFRFWNVPRSASNSLKDDPEGAFVTSFSLGLVPIVIINLLCLAFFIAACAVDLGYVLVYVLCYILMAVMGHYVKNDSLASLESRCATLFIIPGAILIIEWIFGIYNGIKIFGSLRLHAVIAGLILVYSVIFAFVANKNSNSHELKDIPRFYRSEKDRDNDILRTQEALIKLKGALYDEFRRVRAETVNKYRQYLTREEAERLCSQLPQTYWWEVAPPDWTVKASTSSRYFRWEYSRANTQYSRFGNVNMGERYSALYPMEEPGDNSRYKEAENKVRSSAGIVYDIIVESVTNREVVEYSSPVTVEKYKHSGLERLGGAAAYYGLGNDIDRAYNSGALSDSDYNALRTGYVFGGLSVDEKLHEKVSETTYETDSYVRYTTAHRWGGTSVFLKNPHAEGYTLYDYRCESLQSGRKGCMETFHPAYEPQSDATAYFPHRPDWIKVTRILGDPALRDPVIVAEMHYLHRECR
ncbi:MAG: hypothetical protein LUG57_06325 [Oscillospiraceae bacterium]|nr:hypothetical protein [Oscillospiraceae bacterium]